MYKYYHVKTMVKKVMTHGNNLFLTLSQKVYIKRTQIISFMLSEKEWLNLDFLGYI